MAELLWCTKKRESFCSIGKLMRYKCPILPFQNVKNEPIRDLYRSVQNHFPTRFHKSSIWTMRSNNVSIGYNWVGFSGGGCFWNLLQANEKSKTWSKEQDITIPLQVLQFVEWGLGMYCSKNLSQFHWNIEAFQSIDFLKLSCMLNSFQISHIAKTQLLWKILSINANWFLIEYFVR